MKRTLALLVAVVALGCGSNEGHEVQSGQGWNLAVLNYDHHNDVDVWVEGDKVGSIDAGKMAYYKIKPGIRKVAIASADGRLFDAGAMVFTPAQRQEIGYFSQLGRYPYWPPEPDEEGPDPEDERDTAISTR
jgi:hypothetical protein